jgi:hypothetical protein
MFKEATELMDESELEQLGIKLSEFKGQLLSGVPA